jgi:hypothetical protein
MTGGLAFMVAGNMCVGITGEDLMVRVGPKADAEALARPHARPMDVIGRPMKGYVYVAPEGVQPDGLLADWVTQGVAYATTLPPWSPGRATPHRAEMTRSIHAWCRSPTGSWPMGANADRR